MISAVGVCGFDPSPSDGGRCGGRRKYVPVGSGLGFLPRTPAAPPAIRRRLTWCGTEGGRAFTLNFASPSVARPPWFRHPPISTSMSSRLSWHRALLGVARPAAEPYAVQSPLQQFLAWRFVPLRSLWLQSSPQCESPPGGMEGGGRARVRPGRRSRQKAQLFEGRTTCHGWQGWGLAKPPMSRQGWHAQANRRQPMQMYLRRPPHPMPPGSDGSKPLSPTKN